MNEVAKKILKTLYPTGSTSRDKMIEYLDISEQEFDEAFKFLYEKHFIFKPTPTTFCISALGQAEVEVKIGND